ncbi:hypothetical protein HYY75_03615 [bacterium]|nr:hypothetical protein [bacterium]
MLKESIFRSGLFRFFPSVLVSALILGLSSSAAGVDCGNCGKTGIPNLSLICPKCRSNIYPFEIVSKTLTRAILIVELSYTGGNPHRLPPYGKVYINRKYKGNIYLVQNSRPERVQVNLNPRVLNQNCSALYRLELSDLMEGVVGVTVRMRFIRGLGLLRSHRWVKFPRVSLVSGEKTVLRHVFASARWFNRKVPTSVSTQNIDKPRLATSTGVVGIDIPIAK